MSGEARIENREAQSAPAGEAMPMQTTQTRRSALFIVFLVVFIDLLGFGIVLPLLPIYVSEILKPLFPGEDVLTKTWHGLLLGLLMSSFSGMQFLFAPLWGRISDRVGRRPILLLGLMGSVVFYLLFGIASEVGVYHQAIGLILMFVARLGAGIAGATIATAQAVIADSTGFEGRARGMALIGAAFGIGFTFGPLLGFGSLFTDFEGMPGFLAAGLSGVALVLAFRLLPETLHTGSKSAYRRLFDLSGWHTVLRMPTVGILVVIFFLATLAFGSLESTLALVNKFLLNPHEDIKIELTREAVRSTGRSNFLIFAYVGLVLLLVQGLIYRRFVAQVGEIRFMKVGILMMISGLACVIPVLLAAGGRGGHASHGETSSILWSTALLVLTVLVAGYAFMTPSLQALISKRSDPARQGEVLGVNQSASALSRILGPLIAPPLFMATSSHVLPYVFGTLLLSVVCLWAMRMPSR